MGMAMGMGISGKMGMGTMLCENLTLTLIRGPALAIAYLDITLANGGKTMRS